jgi:RNA polymerase sigma-70 factor (ECF subfamily)
MRAPNDDNELVATTLGGDVEAFGTLVERYQKTLFNAAYRITGNREDALEATQTAFLKGYDRLRTFDANHRFFSWIFRIVVNESLDIAHQRRRFVDDDACERSEPAPGDPEADYSAVQASERVHRMVAKLPPDHRVVLVLRYFNELSYSEMAALIGIPEKTVKSRLFSARRELRELFAGDGASRPSYTRNGS